MKFFDKLTDYLHFRRLDNREKILIIVFIVILFQFLVFIFIYNPKIQIINAEESKSTEEIIEKEEKFNYSGLKDFSKENIMVFLDATKLKSENISFENLENSEILKVSLNVHKDNLIGIENILDYYGFKNISIKRVDIDKFNISMEALKKKENTYYKDIRNEYFNPSNKNEILEKTNRTENYKKSSEKIIKNTNKENIKENIKTKNNNKSLSIKIEKVDKNIEKKVEKKIEDIKESDDQKILKTQDLIENTVLTKYVDINNINIECDYYYKYINEENNILAIYINSDVKSEFLDIDLKDDYNFLYFDIFIPYGYEKNIGVVLKDGLYRNADMKLEKGQWNKLYFNYLNIEKIRIELPKNEEIFLIGNIYGQ